MGHEEMKMALSLLGFVETATHSYDRADGDVMSWWDYTHMLTNHVVTVFSDGTSASDYDEGTTECVPHAERLKEVTNTLQGQ